jgi:hypothetical protein
MDIPTAREYIKQREYIDEAVDKAVNLYRLKVTELEERIDELEGKKVEPTKTIELTEEEIEWLQKHLQRQLRIMNSPPGDTLDRVNQRRIDDILYKLNQLEGTTYRVNKDDLPIRPEL